MDFNDNFKNPDSYFYIDPLFRGRLFLSETESRHCIRSFRFNITDIITVTDGKGKYAQAEIINSNPDRCEIEVKSVSRIQLGITQRIHIAIAPTKNIKRFEWFLEKAVEIGIGSITPIICQNSERRIINIDRLKQKAVTTLKQSLQTWLVHVNQPLSFKKFLSQEDTNGKFICHLNSGSMPELKEFVTEHNRFTILIGPEGGFTKAEVKSAEDHHYQTVSLGLNRYRTETAGILACHTICLLNDA